MDIIDCIKGRRSVRKFSDEKISYDDVMELIELGTYAPTAQNKQPWGFLIIQDKEELKRLSDIGKKDILKKIDQLPHYKDYKNWFRDSEYNLFYGAETLVVIFSNKNSAWYKEDATLAAENIILAARGKNIGSCWIGFGEDIFRKDEIKKEYNVPDDYVVVAPLILGYLTREPSLPKRKKPLIFKKSEL